VPVRAFPILALTICAIVALSPLHSQPAPKGRKLSLGGGAIAYVPASLPTGRPAPMVVLLHGAGGGPRQMISIFRDEADRHGVVLLALFSKGADWDLFEELDRAAARDSNFRMADFRPTFSADLPRIRAAMAALRERVPLDPPRTAIGGYSDGASYALALGTHHPEIFGTILSFSPGLLVLPSHVHRAQRVYLSHGIHDETLPFRSTAGYFFPKLKANLVVKFRPFWGGHDIPDAVQDEAMLYLANPAGFEAQRSAD